MVGHDHLILSFPNNSWKTYGNRTPDMSSTRDSFISGGEGPESVGGPGIDDWVDTASLVSFRGNGFRDRLTDRSPLSSVTVPGGPDPPRSFSRSSILDGS